jgi:hypothetical protein
MLSHILAGGCFPLGVGHWMTKCERRGLKKPTTVFHPKSGHVVLRRAYRDNGECHFGNFEVRKARNPRVLKCEEDLGHPNQRGTWQQISEFMIS